MVAAVNPIRRLARTVTAAWRSRVRPSRAAWCCEHIRLSSKTSAEPGRFDLARHTYLRGLLDAVDDPEIDEIVFQGATQIGKTEFVRAVALSQGAVDRAPMMLAGPDQVYAREQRRLLYSMAELSPILRDKIPPERLRNDQWIDLGDCFIYLAWSGSEQRLSGRSCKVVLCSEVDRWAVPVAKAAQRTKAFASHTIIYESSPTDEQSEIADLYDASDRRTFHVPCPVCGAYQELRFFTHRRGPNAGRGGIAGYQTATGEWLTPERARKEAYYICEANGCRIDSPKKNRMVAQGVWCPDGCHVTREGKVTGTPKSPGRRAGFRVSSLYAPDITFGEVAAQYLVARESPRDLQVFWNDWLALRWRGGGKAPPWKELGYRLAGQYTRSSVPAAAWFLTAAADVQADRVYWIVRAWGDRCTSWLVDWGMLRKVAVAGGVESDTEEGATALASDLAQLDEAVLARRFPVAGETALGASNLGVRIMGIDSGYRPTEVYTYVRQHPGDRVVAVAGDPRIHSGDLYRWSALEFNARTHKRYPEGTGRWAIDTNSYKSDLRDRWNADPKQPGYWWLPSDVTHAGEDYLRQIANDSRVVELTPAGRKVVTWRPINKALDVHYWDCEVYARCLADLVVGRNWDASTWAPTVKPDPPGPHAATAHAARDYSENEEYSAR